METYATNLPETSPRLPLKLVSDYHWRNSVANKIFLKKIM